MADLSESEQDEIERRSAVRVVVVHEAIRKEGEGELCRPSSALAWSGFAAGLSMGFSLVGEGLIRAHLPEAAWTPLLAKLGYTFGFLIVVLGRQQLFTENTLTAIVPLLMRRTWVCLKNVLRLWTVVLITNLAGVFLFAWVAGNTEVFSEESREAFAQIGQAAMQHGFGTVLLKGIFGGWLIALMVWLLPAAEVARVGIIIIMTYLVGLGELSHIVAGSVETFYLVGVGQASFGAFLGSYAIPTLLGNIIGGVSIAAALNHAQVVAGET
ncbi:MAG: formate/nitrite transporter family protein [Planctomycetes bacterium]|nr:formate/nitrite transporter family protein [Planctomycetota bacterium]